MKNKMRKEERDPVTEEIIAACYRIHNELGPGFTEKTYSKALQIALKKTDLKYETEKEFSVLFNSIKVGKFRADSVIVELKSVEGKLPKIFE
jgi:GxxExxY protein